MKKAIAFILLLCMMLSCISCTVNNPDDKESSESKKQESSTDHTESVESSVESETTKESVSESESESESESTESSSESESTSETEVVVQITEYGAFSSAITATDKSDDRLKQMALSASAYNKGSTYSDNELDSALKSANKIKTSGALAGYSNASAFIKHFLDNTGEDYEIDMSSFLKDENALSTRDAELNKALRACEVLAVEGERINVYQKEELVHHNLTGDWKYAVGSYFTSIEVKNLTTNGNLYSATFVFKVTDFYNWDKNDDNAVFSGFVATLVGDVSPKDLHQLHRAGKAQEFLSYGEISYTVSWVKGSTVDMIQPFNN